MNEPVAALLFADSGAATPSMAPFPKRSGCLLSFFSSAYEINDEMIAPPPGSTPMKNPSNDPRAIGAADVRHSSRFGNSPRSLVSKTSALIVCSTFTRKAVPRTVAAA